ncbi:MAG: ATP-binding protein [Elusimicrobiota bacterium]
MIIPRDAGATLRSFLGTFPVVLIVGPRQSGKTTLVRKQLPSLPYLDLENPTDRARLEEDPEGLLTGHSRGVIIDEVQRWPEIFPVLRGAVDRKRRLGAFVLTGSAAPSLMKQAGETLAGRVGMLELTPFGCSELARRPGWLKQRWFWGGFPPLYALSVLARKTTWLDQYVSTFLERDIPSFGIRVPPVRLRNLWTMLAHLHGQLLNVSTLARSLDLTSPAVSHHLDILEGAFMIRRLRPYHANIRKRLVKSPKLYIRDSGLLHHLAGLRRPQDLDAWPGRGSSWEGFVIEELIRRARRRWPAPGFHFWGTQAGAEADLIVENGRDRRVFEIKAGATLSSKSLAGVRQCMKDLRLKRGFVIYRGERALTLGAGLRAVPWRAIEAGGWPS